MVSMETVVCVSITRKGRILLGLWVVVPIPFPWEDCVASLSSHSLYGNVHSEGVGCGLLFGAGKLCCEK